MSEGVAADAAEVVVRAHELAYAFGKRRALDGLSLEVRRGEFFGLLGPNGSGKSTLLGLLAGQLVPSAGRLEVEGGVPLEPRGAVWRRWSARLGVIFQSPALDPQLSARENLQLVGRMHGLRGAALAERIERDLAGVRLTERADERVRNLSGGMKRRLDLARALLHDPEVVLLDEPTTGLDEASFRDFWAWLSRLRTQRALTVIVATHRAEEAELCGRVAVIDQGRALAVDTPRALREGLKRDLVTVRGREPHALAELLESRLDAVLLEGARLLATDEAVFIECERGHELVPRLVEVVEAGRISAIELRQATLAEVFLRLTGRALAAEDEVVSAPTRRARA